MESYYSIFKEDKPLHITSSANPEAYASTFFKLMRNYNAEGWSDVAQGSKPIPALHAMVRAVRTPYTHIALADVCAIGTKNFVKIGVEAMEHDASLCQMRYSDDPISCARPYNTSPFGSDGTRVFFKGIPEYPFEPMVASDNTIWRYPMTAAAQKKWMGFAFWPCTYRTEVLQRVVEECEKRLETQQPQWKGTLAGWMSIINRTADMGGWCLPEKGWPEGFEFLEPLSQGTLNMACYEYALGREQKPWAEFIKTSTIEVKSIPPKGELWVPT